MKRTVVLVLTVLMAVAMLASGAWATSLNGNKMGVGGQFMGENFGASFTYDWQRMSRISFQPVLLLSEDLGVAFRGRYAILQHQYFDLMLCGGVGYMDDPLGFASGGVNWDWRSLDRSLPPISWSAEVGMFGETDIGFAVGVHYTFGR